jgi:magnesium transporter
MPDVDNAAPWRRCLELADARDTQGLETYVASLGTGEAVRAVLRLNLEDQEKVLTMLSPTDAADIIEDIPDEQAADLIESLEPKAAATIVREMLSDEQADLLGDLDSEDAEAILNEMEPEDANDARELAQYDDDVAGGLMVREYLSFPESAIVGDVLDDLSAHAEELEEHFKRYAYVVSSFGHLVGVIAVYDLVLSPRHKPLANVMVPALFTKPEVSLEELKNFFEGRSIIAVPVVDNHGRLLGVVRRDYVLEAIAERSDREMMRMRGIVGGDEIRALPTFTRMRRRLSWLSVNIVLNLIAASVIALYIDTLGAVIALAVFLPIISDMSGCTGNQAVAVSMRELALGIAKPSDALRVFRKELSVGLMNGFALGTLLGGVAWLWKGNVYLSLVVGGSLLLNTLIAVSIGGSVPLLLKRFGVDPALASDPILTTITDICGFFLVLSFAALMISKLT